jgi:nuclear pore complex protein Nup107
LLKTLPPNLTSAVDDDEDNEYQLLEHEDVGRLFGVFACHELVDEVLSRAPKAT